MRQIYARAIHNARNNVNLALLTVPCILCFMLAKHLATETKPMPRPCQVCYACDGYGESINEVECATCDGLRYVYEVDGQALAHGTTCDCHVCANGYWLVCDEAAIAEHFDDVRAATIRCVEYAMLNGLRHEVRSAPAYSEPEDGKREYLWNDCDGLEFAHDGDASFDAPGTTTHPST